MPTDNLTTPYEITIESLERGYEGLLKGLPISAPPRQYQLQVLRLAIDGLRMHWQPIETAPRDGTDVMLFFDGAFPKILVSRWRISEHLTDGKHTFHSAAWATPWIGSLDGKDPEPTHWAPLPQAPGAE